MLEIRIGDGADGRLEDFRQDLIEAIRKANGSAGAAEVPDTALSLSTMTTVKEWDEDDFNEKVLKIFYSTSNWVSPNDCKHLSCRKIALQRGRKQLLLLLAKLDGDNNDILEKMLCFLKLVKMMLKKDGIMKATKKPSKTFDAAVGLLRAAME